MPIFAAVLGHVLTNKRLTAALLASLAQLARARGRWFESDKRLDCEERIV